MRYKTIFIICLSFFLCGNQKIVAQSDTFHYVSDTTQTWTVPGCVSQVTVQLWGGGGGCGNYYGVYDDMGYNAGGPGAYYLGVISGLTQGDVLTLYVPAGGGWGAKGYEIFNANAGGVGGWPGGGTGGTTSEYSYGGGGGGYAAIAIKGTYYVVAAGGGGGGGYGFSNCWGGYGGATTGDDGGDYCCYCKAGGGTLTSGGQAGCTLYNCGNQAGSAFHGGDGAGMKAGCDYEFGGGGGGSGYYGGGGGGDYIEGGGGGSSFPGGTYIANGIKFAPNANAYGSDGANASDYLAPYAPNDSIGFGGFKSNGGNGLIVIIYGKNGVLSSHDSALVNPVCGICNGSATVIHTGGASPYTYSWSPGGQTNATATGLCAGTYIASISDSCGNVNMDTIQLVATSLPVTTTVTAHDKCTGNCTGSATAKVGAGTSPYTYSWTPSGGNSISASGLCAGTYTITVTDKNGCTGSATATITEPPAIILTSWTNNVVCTGTLDSAIVKPSGGTSPYTYLWNPSGKTTATVTGLSSGIYTITVTDLNACTQSTNVTILHPPVVTATTGAPVNVLCNGGTGSATVTAGGGVSPYLYSWSPSGGSNAQGTGLSAGSYTVTVTDRNGCTATAGVAITQPILLVAKKDTILHVLCNGGAGSAAIRVSGGTSAYTYLWTPTNQSSDSATGLSAGSYTISVTDNHHCSTSITVTLTQPTRVAATITPVNVLCNGGVGSATVNASGGVSPYTYMWTPTNQTTSTATGLSAGAYTIKVTDNHGCTLTNTVTITQPAVLTATMGSPNNIRCYGGTGSVTVTAAGGTIPYTYSWNPSGQITATATGLFAGSFTVTVTDAHHCTASATVTMTQPTAVGASTTISKNISCMNGSDGSITAAGSGGTPPYTYLWSPGGNTNATATGLFALSYTATVTDNNGCTATSSVTLTEPAQVTVSISEPRIICKDSTGILIANGSGGTAPYKYNWSSGATDGTATITPIATNDYSVQVTDSHGCAASANVILQYGPAFAVDITGKKSVCVGDSTDICAEAIGAIDGVVFQWTPSNSTNGCILVSPSSASVYTVTVVDGCGSTTTAQANVTIEPSPVVNMEVNFSQGCAPFCVQFRNQSTLSKGKVSQYIWEFGNGDTSRAENPISCYKSPGEYNVSLTVISDSGCSATLKKMDMLNIYAPPKAAFTYSSQPVSILSPTVYFEDLSTDPNGKNGGIIYWTWSFSQRDPSGGDQSDSISNEENPTHTYHDTGMYCVNLQVMNREGCTDTTTDCLVVEPNFTLYIPSAFTPNGDGLNDIFKPIGQYVKTFEMYIFERWGMEIFHSSDINIGWNGAVNGNGPLCQEDIYVYKIIITDDENNYHSYIGNVTLLK